MFQNRSIQFEARARDADGYLGTKFTPFQNVRDQRRSERKWEKQICCHACLFVKISASCQSTVGIVLKATLKAGYFVSSACCYVLSKFKES